MPEAPLFLIATIRPRPDRVIEAERELRVLMEATRNEPGCLFMELVESPDEPGVWTMLEKFRSREDWDDHMRTEHVIRGNAALQDLLSEPTDLRLLTQRAELR